MNYKINKIINIKNFTSFKFLCFYELIILHFFSHFSHLHLFLHLFFPKTLINFSLFVKIKI